MKVIRARKTFRNGEEIKRILIPFTISENPTEEEIQEEKDEMESAAIMWAEHSAGGQNYGWRVEWEVETDQEIIENVIREEILNLNQSLKNSLKFKMKLEDELFMFNPVKAALVTKEGIKILREIVKKIDFKYPSKD